MELLIKYNEEKNFLLKETRGICFEDVIKAVEKGKVLDNLKPKNRKRYPNQQVLVVEIKNYVWAVPYAVDKKKGVIFLKTVYPSRVLSKKYFRKE